jgi:hypothetical protein
MCPNTIHISEADRNLYTYGLGGAQELLDEASDGLDDGVLGEVRLVDLGHVSILFCKNDLGTGTYSLADSIELAAGSLATGKFITGNSKLNHLLSLVNGIPTRSSSGVLDPLNEPVVDRIGKSLLSLGDTLEGGEALIAAMEERNLSTVGRSSVGGSNNIVVLAEEAVDPGLLLLTSHVEEVVNGTVEASITILDTAAKRLGGVVVRVVGLDQRLVGDMSAISIEGVDPRAEVAVLSAVDEAEDGALSIGGTSQHGNMGRIVASSKTGRVVGEAGDIINDGSEPGVESGVKVLGLEVKDVNVAETVELTVTTLGAANFLGDGVKSLIDGSVSGAGHGVGAHLDGTLEEGVGVVP